MANSNGDGDGDAGTGQPSTDTVIGKVAKIIDSLAASDGVLGLSELARTSGIAKSTVHRICGELIEWGVVERSGDAFRLGSRLFELGSQVPGRRLLRDTALPIMEDLSTVTQQTVHLAVLEGTEVMYVERLPGRSATEVPSSVAGRLPLHCTATGRCLLANGPDRLLKSVLSAGLESKTERSIKDPDALRETLAAVLDDGFAIERGEVSEGLMSVGVAVFELGGRLAGALSVTGSEEVLGSRPADIDDVVDLVRDAAAELSRRLGAPIR